MLGIQQASKMGLGHIRYSTVKRYTFIDKDDVEIGSIADVVLDHKTLIPSHIILGAGFFEELMETIGKKEDIDEIAPIEIIERLDDGNFQISISVDDLEHTLPNGKLPFQAFTLMQLKELTIRDQNGVIAAEISDIEIDDTKSRLYLTMEQLNDDLYNEGFMQRFDVSYKISDLKINDNILILPSSMNRLMEIAREIDGPKTFGKTTILWE